MIALNYTYDIYILNRVEYITVYEKKRRKTDNPTKIC